MNAATKAWYWLAAGVLALGLNGYYQDGGMQALHRISNRATTAVAETRAQLQEAAVMTQVAFAEHATCQEHARTQVAVNAPMMPAEAEARVAEIHARLARAEAAQMRAQLAGMEQVMMRREMRQARVEIQNGRLELQADPGQVRLLLPPVPRVEVNVPQAAVRITPN
jgi:hypothetical protein